MPITGLPLPSLGSGQAWGNGSGTGGLYSSARVTTLDKAAATDINQLRDIVEALYGHTHFYVDNAGKK